MPSTKDLNWYAQYISESASVGDTITSYTAIVTANNRISLIWTDPTGWLMVIDTSIASTALALLTLIAGFVFPFICVRVSRSVAVAWALRYSKLPRLPGLTGIAAPSPSHRTEASYLPILLGNAGFWIADAWVTLMLLIRSWQKKTWSPVWQYGTFLLLCVIGAIVGPLTALLVSRQVIAGFAGKHPGPCFPPTNFTDNATNYVSLALDDHGRAIDLLPWAGSFGFPWNASSYIDGNVVEHPISQTNYERLDTCILNDPLVCHNDFPHNHKVSVELPASRFGLWYDNDWSINFEGYCVRLNSKSFGWQNANGIWYYALSYLADSTILPECQGNSTGNFVLGWGETELFNKRKNVVTDTWFGANNEADRNWPCQYFPPAIRALNTEEFSVVTIFPTRQEVNQIVHDELYLPQVNVSEAPSTSNGTFLAPNQLAHLLCWEKQSLTFQGNRTIHAKDMRRFAAENKMPAGFYPLWFYSAGEFMLKSLRYLRQTTLLQSISEVPAGEYRSNFAPPVPFGAEMHRWAHIGTLDVLSKATRMATGHYRRATSFNSTVLTEVATQELRHLCDAVRVAKAGVIALPLWVIILLFAFLGLAAAWWLVEHLLIKLAQRGSTVGVTQGFLVLPAITPTSLSANVKMALASGTGSAGLDNVYDSASGWPDVDNIPLPVLGPVIQFNTNGRILRWSVGRGEEEEWKSTEKIT
jgi:hypothetical protein